jgi:hypothetical protein
VMTIFVILHRAGIIKNSRNIFLYPGIGIFRVCCCEWCTCVN